MVVFWVADTVTRTSLSSLIWSIQVVYRRIAWRRLYPTGEYSD